MKSFSELLQTPLCLSQLKSQTCPVFLNYIIPWALTATQVLLHTSHCYVEEISPGLPGPPYRFRREHSGKVILRVPGVHVTVIGVGLVGVRGKIFG